MIQIRFIFSRSHTRRQYKRTNTIAENTRKFVTIMIIVISSFALLSSFKKPHSNQFCHTPIVSNGQRKVGRDTCFCAMIIAHYILHEIYLNKNIIENISKQIGDERQFNFHHFVHVYFDSLLRCYW